MAQLWLISMSLTLMVCMHSFRFDDSSFVSSMVDAGDSATVTVNPVNEIVTAETGNAAEFTVVLDSQPSAGVTIGVSSSDVGEGTVSAPFLTFASEEWNITQTVTVTGVDDVVVDGNASFNIMISIVNSSDTNFHGMSVPDVGITNTDSK